MNKRTFYLAITMMVIFTSCIITGPAFADGPIVLRFKIEAADYEIDIPKPVLKSLKHQTKPYTAEGRIDPFDDSFMYAAEEKIVDPAPEPEPVFVPDTALTKWTLAQLRLEGTVISDKYSFAAFRTPAGPKCFKAEVGDYLGKDGFVITSIINGLVEAMLDDAVHQYKTFQ